MKTINFNKLPVFTGISRTETKEWDAREAMANLVYNNAAGKPGHKLAHKIYNSKEEPIQLDMQEEELLFIIANEHCIPAIIDSLHTILDNQ